MEAAGIEPASEDRAIQTSTCVVGGVNLVKLPVHRQTCNFTNLLNFALGSKAAPLTIPLDRRFFPDERTHQRETWLLFFRQPLHSYNLQLNYFPTFLRGWSEPRHAAHNTHDPVETLTPPLALYYNIVIFLPGVKYENIVYKSFLLLV